MEPKNGSSNEFDNHHNTAYCDADHRSRLVPGSNSERMQYIHALSPIGSDRGLDPDRCSCRGSRPSSSASNATEHGTDAGHTQT